MNIDWSKAPVWANAVIASQDGQEFYVSQWGGISARQRIGYSWADSDDSADMTSPHDWVLVTTRQGEWAGEGLPPVGTVCEINNPNLGWIQCEIVAHKVMDCGGKPHAIAWIDGNTIDQSQGIRFRPIRTPEQIAAEEREREVELAIQTLNLSQFCPDSITAQNTIRHVVGEMITAGYRKFEIVDKDDGEGEA